MVLNNIIGSRTKEFQVNLKPIKRLKKKPIDKNVRILCKEYKKLGLLNGFKWPYQHTNEIQYVFTFKDEFEDDYHLKDLTTGVFCIPDFSELNKILEESLVNDEVIPLTCSCITLFPDQSLLSLKRGCAVSISTKSLKEIKFNSMCIKELAYTWTGALFLVKGGEENYFYKRDTPLGIYSVNL